MPRNEETPKIFTIEVLERKRVTIFARTREEAIKYLKTHATGNIIEMEIVGEILDDERCQIKEIGRSQNVSRKRGDF